MRNRTWTVLLAGFALSACISLLPDAGPGPDIYRLTHAATGSQASETAITLLLPVVKAPKELKNNRVALIRNGSAISYAANARWAASTPEMLQQLLADALRHDGALSVIFPGDGVKPNFEVRVILRAFEAQYDQGFDAAPQGVVSYRVRLVDPHTRQLIGEEIFQVKSRSADIRLGSIVAAIDVAAHEAARQMAIWVTERSANP
ncbi:MAG: hypothetical protein COA47_09675 [Robiginitomaculum sp.]|nr:MAG: hypothetical protein COA47_09675 [Robiginitomaculum sp.]